MPDVYQGVWRDYGLPANRGWVLTLKDNRAVALIAFITTFVAFSQSRAWEIEANIFCRLTSPKIQLTTSNNNKDVLMSQGSSIKMLVRTLSRRQTPDVHRFRHESPWLGLIALINIAIFITMGIILPWSISGGNNPNSLVRSATANCSFQSPSRLV